MTIIRTNWLEARARTSPDKIAIIDENQEITYDKLFQLAKRAAYTIQNHLPEDKRIAIMLSNGIEAIVLIHAMVLLPKELILINTRLTQEEISYQLSQTEVDTIISHSDFDETLSGIDNVNVLTVDNSQNFPKFDYQEGSPILSPISDDSILCLVYTSGTTGKPKAVPLTYSNFYYSAIASAVHLGTVPDDRWLLTLPAYHLGGLSIIFRSCLYGITIVSHPGFDVNKIVNDLVIHRITLLSVVPYMLQKLIELIPDDHCLRIVLVGGAAVDEPTVRKALTRGLPIATTYGMTETCSQFATALPELVRRKPTTVGKPLLFSEVKIFDPDQDGIGELGLKGPTVTPGYYMRDKTESFREGWFLTGDLGYADNDGDLHIVQRRTDLIISGGENIYPSEVEQALESLPDITEACVIGLQNPEWGQVPVALLRLRNDTHKVEIVSLLRDKLAGYKIPRQYFKVNNFPRTSSGKIIRSEIRDWLVSDREDDRILPLN